MQLRYISVPLLVGEAGGDPWEINQSLQAGRPAQISDLAEAFHAAGRCTAESNNAFAQARQRFAESWNREDSGEHPINDSAEVQKVTKSLGAQSLQLPKIGVTLENVAASLAQAQKAAAGQISALEGQLQQLDEEIGEAVELEKNPSLTAAERQQVDAFITAREDDAINDTKAALGSVKATRDGYSYTLQNALGALRAEGYDPAGIRAQEGPLPPVPPLPDDPKQFAQAWNSLTKEQKDAAYDHDPFIGNHGGMPAVDRDHYNRMHLDELQAANQADLDRLRAQHPDSGQRRHALLAGQGVPGLATAMGRGQPG